MHKYVDTKMFMAVLLAGIALFFLKHLLTREVNKGGVISTEIGTKGTGYTGAH